MGKIVIFGLLGRGGNLYYTACLANACAKKFETYAVIPSYSNKSLFSKNVKILQIDAPANVLGTIKSMLKFWDHNKLIKQIKEINPDIVHFKDNHLFYIYYARRLKKKCKIYWTCHDPEFHSGEKFSIFSFGDKAVHNYLGKISDKILVHGNYWKNYVAEKKKISKDKIISIKHGTFDFLTKYGHKNTKTVKKTFLFFGRIVEYKGIDTLLKAMDKVVEKIPSAKLIIAGQGNFSPYIKLISEKIKKNVDVVNRYIGDDELADFFRKSHFVVVAYNDATQSGVIPVAYSFRKPVIATKTGALPEMMGKNTGILIEAKNPDALAGAIIEMLKDERKTAKMGENAYKWMKKELDWTKVVKTSYKDIL